jgi:hypothetical protein
MRAVAGKTQFSQNFEGRAQFSFRRLRSPFPAGDCSDANTVKKLLANAAAIP